MLLQSNSYLGEPKKGGWGYSKKFFKSDPRAQNFRGRPGTKKKPPHHDNNTHTYTRMGIREIFLKKPAKQKCGLLVAPKISPLIMLIIKKKGGGSQKNIFKKRWLKKVPEPVAAKEYEVRVFFYENMEN